LYAGHVGIGLGLRRLRWAPPLWVLVLAAQLPDWGDALLELSGTAPREPGWSPHGFPLLAAGALGVGLVGWRLARGWRGGAIAAAACLSHWAADYVTGWKPTWPGGPTNVGLMWYFHPRRDFALEVAVTVVGWALWRGTLPRPAEGRGARGRRALEWGLLALLVVLQGAVDGVMARRNGGW
jgi:hypothetical protein